MSNRVQVIGMGLSPRDLTQAHLEIIQQAQVLVGGKRHLESFESVDAVKREIASPISEVLDFIQESMADKRVVVLASGDPLFFGIGKTLINRLGAENVVVHPNVTSMAAAFARLNLPWQEAYWVSLHGKKGLSPLKKAMEEHDLLCVLTDPANNPEVIAEVVKEHDYSWNMRVLEKLGDPEERVLEIDPFASAFAAFAQPNVVVLQKGDLADPPGPLRLGTPDHWFIHEKGLITKAPVRTLSLSMLQLESSSILWDLGAGSGSVGLEASLFLPQGFVFAVEKNAARVEQIQANAERFNVQNLSVTRGEAPEGLDDLPRPDRVFIGGGGKGLPEVLETAMQALKPHGKIVVNTVLLETLNQAVSLLEEKGFAVSLTQAQISQSKTMPWGRRMEALNPVWIILGEKGK
ncbi:precorrin-6y C5,15-methyltransferase (decarboxylating), CbiE subunit [Desulfatibacillum aliphaticivorans]|uniref:Precorrin-6y C5,15-methyltransferase (Decarboxylating), CbiE subunit n=1 Tax=Desulfatibacillum aliphaticivorans TaxID=218208 RepID=B8FH68_DESAL|nr:bifunctional cobalt-precorrin-7 (C(5))-methyltransferase/cobalt-precorrin-6B (C(15))-methyltransferase [Desulfatibacillum aliphaticivorans]ACL02156.1 precorrin-6y C5,15-methyltransferase (decarboxylating), CbiE subunit [Desulfatibacillum aliphaticivorans]